MTAARPIPYPAATKAKGWRFELDLEQVQQSDTWALAKPSTKPWLLMLWAVAWQQIPCGSMPSDDELIIARLGIDPEVYQDCKRVLMRGWWLAEDGRLYHDTIVSRVMDMLGRKEAERARKAAYRARMEAERKLADANEEAQMSHGTDMGQTWDSSGRDDTGTGTGTGTGLDSSTHTARAPEPAKVAATARGKIAMAIRATGMADLNTSHPTFTALIDQGVTAEEFQGAARDAVSKGKGFGYMLAIVTGRRKEAAEIGTLPKVPAVRPNPASETPYQRKMRETAQGLAPGVARRSEHSLAPTPLTVDMEASHAPAIARH